MRISAYASLAWESLWPLLVPAFLVFCSFFAFSWAGGWHYLNQAQSPVLIWIVRILFAVGAGWALYNLRQFKRPDEQEIIRRIEVNSDLQDRPITAQEDKIAMGGTNLIAQVLWREHQTRMEKKLDTLTSGLPAPKANRFDPFAIRAILPLIAFAAFFFSYSPYGGKISDVYVARSSAPEIPTRIDAWVKPPTYTRTPPIYLSLAKNPDQARIVSAPLGSEFFLRYVGADEVVLTSEGAGDEVPVKPTTGNEAVIDQEFKFTLDEDQGIKLKASDRLLSQWGITLVPDNAPQIEFTEEPGAALSGSLQMSYSVEDDYGVVQAKAIIEALDALDPNARPLIAAPEVNLALPRARAKKGTSKINKDLTDHPWAGSKIRITLEAIDDRGQVGRSKLREITLPGRRFSKPLALALVEQRRILAMDANQQSRVANLLDAVSHGAEGFVDDASIILGMRVAYRRMQGARNDDDLRASLDLLWDIALAVEFGDLSEVERNLREAQERLSEALEKGADKDEIDRLMKELRQAMNDMIQALSEQARNNPQSTNPFEQNNDRMLSQNDLERMMDRIEDLAKSGSEDAARQMLSELQRMMDNLRAGRHQQQRQAEGNQLNKALDKLSELMQEQQRLLNESYRMQQQQEQGLRPDQKNSQQQGQNQQNQQQGEQQQSGDKDSQMSAEELAEALKQLQEQQEELKKQLSELGEQLEELGLGVPHEMDNAGEEMGQAGENLGEGDAGGAASHQGKALEAMRQGAQNMMQQMAGDRQTGSQQQSQDGGQGQANQRRGSDPLGRRANEDGLNANSDVELPGEIDSQRARRILEAIRERLAIPDNPLIEKDYLERLLNSE